MTFAVVPSVSIDNLVNQRAAVIEKINAGIDLLREAGTLAGAAHLGMPRMVISNTYRRGTSDERSIADSYLRPARDGSTWEYKAESRAELTKMVRLGVDAAGWQYLMHESGLRTLMDATAREKWDKAIGEGDFPELTIPNIHSTFGMLHDSRSEMFERGVIACFKSLSWHYKTNLPARFGKRVVIANLTGYHSHTRYNELDDLVRVFSVLDGKPEPDHRSGISSALSKAGLGSYCGKAGEVDTDYLSIRCFKNHNGHVTFKRPELVDQMNRIIAKHYPGALPAPR